MLKALFTTTAVSHWLDTTKTPRVLHVFDQVCNLVDGERRVVSLVTPEIGKGPFSLVVDLPYGNFTDFITSESKISVQICTCHAERSEASQTTSSSNAVGILRSAQTCTEHSRSNDGFVLQIGSLVIDTSLAKLWDTRPLWENLSPSAIEAYLPLFESKLASASPDSLAFVNGRSDSTSLKAKKAITTLQTGLKTGNLAACQEGAHGLAGLGVGLTPAGDDFLMGVIFGLFQHKGAETQRVINILVDEAVARTTTLSGAWLEAAGRGEAGQPWHELVEAMGGGGGTACVEPVEVAVSQAIDRILSIGHTSGADALAGFAMAIKD